MSEPTGPPTGDYGIVGNMARQLGPIQQNMAEALWGKDGVEAMRAQAEEDAAVEAKHMRRSELRERLESIQRVIITITLFVACLVCVGLGFEVLRIMHEVTP